MSLILINPMQKVAERIYAYYMQHPDLLEQLLVRLGAQDIQHRWGKAIHCTCPLHGGSNRRGFVLYYDHEVPVWRCFSDSCGKGSLAWLIQRKYPNASFDQAVVSLGRLCGITVDGSVLQVGAKMVEEETLSVVQRRLGITPNNRRQQTINVFPDEMLNESIANLYQPTCAEIYRWLTGPVTEVVRNQKCRQIPPHILQQFQIGFVPANRWAWVDPKSKARTGWFLDYVSFPWRYVDGRLMGFAGRRTDGLDFQKYKTLPGTMRALTLWGLGDPKCLAEIRRTGVLHLVEGYTDVMRGHEHACHNIAAVGGTELTEEQWSLLTRIGVNCIVNYFDGDDAGQNASQSIGKRASRSMKVMSATPPVDKDPGDLVEYQQFWTPIVQAQPFVSRSVR